MSDKIEFYAEVIGVKDMVDGSIRVTFGLPEDKGDIMAIMHDCKVNGIVLDVVATAREFKANYESDKSSSWKEASEGND